MKPAYLSHKPGEPWTYPQLRSIAAANRQQGDINRIAAELGTSVRYLRNLLTRHGIPYAPETVKLRAARTISVLGEASASEVCARTGDPMHAVARRLRRLRADGLVSLQGTLPARNSAVPNAQRRKLYALTQAGHAWLASQEAA